MRKNAIQLDSERDLYEMTFSDGGHSVLDRVNIQYEWGHLNEATYYEENRDKWRRRYWETVTIVQIRSVWCVWGFVNST